MTMPFVFFPDYEFEIDDENQNKLDLHNQEDMLIYTLITVNNGKVQDMTANLMAPIIMNTANMQARQIVLDRSSYNTKHRLFPQNKEEQ
jgi:flagellar assembly factor FliW